MREEEIVPVSMFPDKFNISKVSTLYKDSGISPSI